MSTSAAPSIAIFEDDGGFCVHCVFPHAARGQTHHTDGMAAFIRSTWIREDGRTPAGGTSYVEPGGRRCATDYGSKVRLFFDQDTRSAGKGVFPCHFLRSVDLQPRASRLR